MLIEMKTRYGNVNLDSYEENGVNIVTHTSLSLLLNKYRAEGHVEDVFVPLTEQIIDTVNGIYVAEVRLKDNKTGVVFRGIGEVNPSNIGSTIARQNPIIMAFNRAEDKAFLALLGTEKRFYSSIEMDNDMSSSAQPISACAKKKPEVTEPNDVTKNTKTQVTPPPVGTNEENLVAGTVSNDINMSVEPIKCTEKDDSPFLENEPVINPVINSSQSLKDAGPLEEISRMQGNVNTNEQANEQTSADKGITSKEATEKKDPIAEAGETIIPNGRCAGKKLKEADQAWLDWFADIIKGGSLPPKYTPEFAKAYKIFVGMK